MNIRSLVGYLKVVYSVFSRPLAFFSLILLSTQLFIGCSSGPANEGRIVIWHQMRPDERAVLQGQIQRYLQSNLGLKIDEIYKETEELRNGFVIASIAGQGPDLVYGPSDPVGIYEATNTVKPLESLFNKAELSKFDSTGLLYYRGHLYMIADKIGNHLALVYNKKYVLEPPQTDSALIALSHQIQAKYGSVAGRPNVYGIVWNYTEPFFFVPFLTGFGGWVFASDGTTPTLDTDSMVNGLRFVMDLRDKYKIIPNESDYEIADALFKDGKAAMLINGDWSWSGYLQAGIDIGISPLPVILETGLRCAPMTSPKGYSVNNNVSPEKLPHVLALMRFLLSEECQLETSLTLNTAPTRKRLYETPEIQGSEIIRNSLLQIRYGRPMPVVPEMRAVWDAMRPGYQSVMGGAQSPKAAAISMQQLVEKKIRDMKE